MVINYKHFNICILFPEVDYCCSTYNVPPTTCGHLLTRTLSEFQISLSQHYVNWCPPHFPAEVWRQVELDVSGSLLPVHCYEV